MDPVMLIVGAWLLLSGKSGSSSTSKKAARSDGDALIARANQPRATEWVQTFMGTGVDAPPLLAQALARWAGIESSGDPLAVSKIGERGLLQCTKTTALTEHAYTTLQWDKLTSPGTSRTEQAALAYQLSNWCWARALKYVTNPPTDFISAVWYAKLYHSRPADLRDAHAHGPALQMARELAHTWADDPAKMHRLRVANVVAFGVADP